MAKATKKDVETPNDGEVEAEGAVKEAVKASEEAADENKDGNDKDEDEDIVPEETIEIPVDPVIKEQQALIQKSEPRSELEVTLSQELKRREDHILRMQAEIQKLKAFISKRKQTYKRKRKDEGAPTRALSGYNIFVKERFLRLAKENAAALKSADTDAVLKRVPPASLVASTGNQWKELSNEEKQYYEDKAKTDRKRYDEQMAKYQPPEKQGSRKRNKTGYNMFFSAHVLRLKQTEAGVPSERGSVARLVGSAWKELSAEEKQYYEREADRENGLNPVERDNDDAETAGKKSKKGASAAAASGEPRAPVVHQPEHASEHYQQHYMHPAYQQQYAGYDYSQMQGYQQGYYDQRSGYPQGYYQYPPEQGQQGT